MRTFKFYKCCFKSSIVFTLYKPRECFPVILNLQKRPLAFPSLVIIMDSFIFTLLTSTAHEEMDSPVDADSDNGSFGGYCVVA